MEGVTGVVSMFDMTRELDEGIKAIEEALIRSCKNEHVVCALMGGDGSISRNVNYILEHSQVIKTNINSVAFVFLPFGTGNDCARSLGWGPRDTGQAWAKDIASLANACCSQNYDRLTLWDVEICADTYVVQEEVRGQFTHKLAH